MSEFDALRPKVDTLRAFVADYVPETLTHEPTGGQLTGYTVIRADDTHARFVHSESDEAKLVEHVRALLVVFDDHEHTPVVGAGVATYCRDCGAYL